MMIHRTIQRLLASLAILLSLVCVEASQGQELWDYSPYHIEVWLGMGQGVELTPGLRQRIVDHVSREAGVIALATWDIKVIPPPAALATDATLYPELIDIPRLEEHALESLKKDKLFLVSITEDITSFRMRVREIDCRTHLFSPVIDRLIMQRDYLPKGVFESVVKLFAPIAKIESAKQLDATIRVRAGGLIVDEFDPVTVGQDDVFLPVIRKQDRFGKATGITSPPWTFLTISEMNSTLLECKIHSGLNTPLGNRASSRKQRYAISVKPVADTTTLAARTRGKDSIELVGYDVYAKDPISSESELVGKTDWRGEISIPKGGHALRIVYVRSGGNLLARLPIVPGFVSNVEAEMRDDRPRLREEGFVHSLQSRLTDLVAQRAILEKRFEQNLSKDDITAAGNNLKSFGQLDDLRKIQTRMREREGLASLVGDRTTQGKIVSMFKETNALMTKFLPPGKLTQMQSQLAAKIGGQNVPAAIDTGNSGPATAGTYLERRAVFKTSLKIQGPAPAEPDPLTPPADVREVTYQSAGNALKAWVHTTSDTEKKPALVFLHGGFYFSNEYFETTRPFINENFVVMAPMLRGENGNPGNHELMLGEVDDAKAAIQWLSQQPYVDANRIFVFGYQEGGAIASLLSLMEGVSMQHSASCDGLYPASVFEAWDSQGIVPFNIANSDEKDMRVLIGKINQMKSKHFAYIGNDAQYFVQVANQIRPQANGSQLSLEAVAGDHETCLPAAIQAYLLVCKQAN
ncbi:MAG: alpha/beta superfamily hydrolase [Pirellulaceae bacterium]|jgi:alpha/beta superfamily hydrolase